MSDIEQRIKGIDITDEMQKSYLDYAMSVIVARALPDVRDGLKPVHRRILFAMSELNLTPGAAYKKSARIVGDTMGKYHPHGDSSIYDAMVRMAQEWSMRYVLVDGHGNFGSMDGDAAAAHRYTEARLSRLSMEMLTDIEKETVDFVPNYDEQFMEPSVLPARFPNLLVNGAMGIAVGMSTSIPPHNLTDVTNAILHRISDKQSGAETEIKTLIDIVKAPDYPTGGAILGTESVREAYRTGRGKVVLRADTVIEPIPGAKDREQIRVTAIPYQVNKANLVIKMAELVKDKKIEGITDIRDESNRNGVRIIIELRRDANANVVLNKLYKLSPLQESHGIIMLALVNNEPKILNLAEMIEHYISHQQEVITRRTQFDLAKAERRAHIVEGLLKALDHVDEIIAILRSHNDESDVAPILMERFDLTEIQVKAILDLRWRALLRLAREKLEDEHKALMELIAELRKILADGNYLLQVLTEELTKIRDKFGDERRTAITFDPSDINIEDLIDEAQSVITLSNLNYIKRIPLDTYRTQGRAGRGVIGAPTREEDYVTDLFVANTHDNILFFTTRGRAFSLRAFEIPEAGRQAKGMPIVNLLNLSEGETIAAMIPVTKNDLDGFLIMVTRKGLVKRTAFNLYSNIRKSGLNAITFREDDTLIEVLRSDGERELFLATMQGRGIRFAEEQARAVGRMAMGVRGMKLRDGDEIIGATVADGQVILAATNGYGKVTPMDSFRGQNRGGYGNIAYKPSEKTGNLIGIEAVSETDGLIIVNSDCVIIRIRIADISVQGRYASGVKLINMQPGCTIVSIAKIPDDDNNEEEDTDAETTQE